MEVQMEVVCCANCGVVFAMTKHMVNARREDHKTFFCPKGHQNYFSWKSDVEVLQDKLKQRDQELAEKQKLLDASRNDMNAMRNSEIKRLEFFIKEQFKLGKDVVSLNYASEHFKMKKREVLHLARLAGFECKRSKSGYQISKKEK